MSRLWRDASKREPCPHCGGKSFCSFSMDGRVVICRRNLNGPGAIPHSDALADGALYFTGGGTGDPARYQPPPEPERADEATLDRVYRAALGALGLSPAHRLQLTERGLDGEQIDRRGYRTLGSVGDRNRVVFAATNEVEGTDLATVPGFVRKGRAVRFTSAAGLLIPVRARNGQVIALKVRRDSDGDGDRYRWVSSRLDGGPSPRSPAHVALHEGERTTVRITEGPLKADVITALTGVLTIGIAGATCIRPALEMIGGFGAQRVLLAWDADKSSNKHVASGLNFVAEALSNLGVEIAVEHWPAEIGKGLDDVLAAGHAKEVGVYEGMRAWRVIAETLQRAGAVIPPRTAELAAQGGFRAAVATDATTPGGAPPAREAPAVRVGPRSSKPVALSDTGNAEVFIRTHGKDIRFDAASGRWLVWDGARWTVDEVGEVHALAKDALLSRVDEPDQRMPGFVQKSASQRGREAMVALARNERGVTVRHDQLDSDPWLFNCANGTLNLRTGELKSHWRQDLITKQSPVRFDPSARSPLWEKFLAEALPDASVRAFLQRFIGYAMTGVVTDHVLPINFGSGRNGKGVFTNTILRVLGSYGRAVPTELFMEKRNDAHPTERTTLLGIRLGAAGETEEGRAMNVALVKQLTGGDPITARYMHRDFFEFQPTHKLMLSTNHRPVIRETKNAIWARVRMVPWTVSFEGREDRDLESKLGGESPGILRWAFDGCRAWQQAGLAAPTAIHAATDAFRGEMDRIQDFLDEVCEPVTVARTKASALYKAYTEWCERSGTRPRSQTIFGEKLAEKGFHSRKNSVIVYEGIRLLSGSEVAERTRRALEEKSNGTADPSDHEFDAALDDGDDPERRAIRHADEHPVLG